MTGGFDKQHTEDFLLLVATRFQDALDNLRSQEYFYEKVFKYLPGKVLPPFFFAFVGKKKDSTMSPEFKKISWIVQASHEKQLILLVRHTNFSLTPDICSTEGE